MKPSVAFDTLGCRLNRYESDSLAEAFARAGFEILGEAGSETPEAKRREADVHVVNSCTVTARADRKSRNVAHRSARRLDGNRLTIVTGCATMNPKAVFDSRPNVLIVDNTAKANIPDIALAWLRGEIYDAPAWKDAGSFSYLEEGGRLNTRAFLKVQDGCDNFCSFCIIPQVRGRAVSRSFDDVVSTAARLVARGRRELVLTGVNIGRWRDETRSFVDLVEALLQLDGDFRLRLSSLEPDGLGQRFFELFRHPKLCPSLHLCFQSGSDRILFAMRRQYTVDDLRRIVASIRAVQPDLVLSTDIITGFPGESEEDFAASQALVDELRAAHVHVFPFSPRSGTRAGRLTEAFDQTRADARAQLFRDADASRQFEAFSAHVGRPGRIVVEKAFALAGKVWIQGLNDAGVPLALSGTRTLDQAWALRGEFAAGVAERVGEDGVLRGRELP